MATSLSYASSSSVEYSEELGMYVGEMVSIDGVHLVEGPDRASVEYTMEAILQEEYQRMVREAALAKELEQSQGRSMGGGGSSSRYDGQKEKIEGAPVHRHALRAGIPGKKGTWVELVMGAISLSQGAYLEAAFSAASLVIKDWYEGVESLWDKKTVPKIFAVYFGGILIKASSKSELRKKLVRQRNKRIQLIMTSIRKHNHEHENASSTDKISADARRLRDKKKRAEILRPKSWERRMSPQGQQTGWRSKTLDLRSRMKGKKSRAKVLWANRL